MVNGIDLDHKSENQLLLESWVKEELIGYELGFESENSCLSVRHDYFDTFVH
jgi:hypothetical protein